MGKKTVKDWTQVQGVPVENSEGVLMR